MKSIIYGDDNGMFGDFFRYWDELPQDGGFQLFGWIHIGWLVGIIFVCIVTGYYYRKADAAVQDRILKILTGICLCLELGKDLYLILIGEMGISYLPFEMCGLAIFCGTGICIFPPGISGRNYVRDQYARCNGSTVISRLDQISVI